MKRKEQLDGKIILRINKEQICKLEKLAEINERTLSGQARAILKEFLEKVYI